MIFQKQCNFFSERNHFLSKHACDWKQDSEGEFDTMYSEAVLLDAFGKYDYPRDIAELAPHFAQCLLMLAMSIERYILICHPSSAKQLLSRPRRILFAAIITFLVFSLILFVYVFYAVTLHQIIADGEGRNYYDTMYREVATVTSQKYLK